MDLRFAHFRAQRCTCVLPQETGIIIIIIIQKTDMFLQIAIDVERFENVDDDDDAPAAAVF